MSVRGNLAENLRRLCLARGSINSACRDMGLNRQQFERYLTMQSTPSLTTLKTLCRYFNVEEQELFADPPRIDLKTGNKSSARMLASCKETLEPLFDLPAPSLNPGIYYLWIAIPGMHDFLMCTAIFIKREGDMVTFRRMTGFATKEGSHWSHIVGNHKGVILERLNSFLLTGINQTGTKEPSLIRLRWVPLSLPVLSGHGMVLTQNGPSVVAVAMHPAKQGTDIRSALKNSKIFSVNDPFVEKYIVACIDQQKRDLGNIYPNI